MITVFTSTYNRANTISRVFNSLMNQTYRDFEWIIVDDGSIDNTREIIEDFKKKSFFKIRYFYQKNAGKHIAINTGIIEARGEYFTNIDSDDEIKSESFEVLIDYWSKIPDNEKNNFKSVTARCYDPETKKGIGYEIPKEGWDLSSLDARFKHKMKFDRWGLSRTKVMKEFLNPEIERVHFYPESIIQDNMARKYKERYVNEQLLGYYKDQENSIIKSKKRSKENLIYWTHNLNNNLDYFIYDVAEFCKYAVGVTRDGLLEKKHFNKLVRLCHTFLGRCLVIIFSPIGFILYLKSKDVYNS